MINDVQMKMIFKSYHTRILMQVMQEIRLIGSRMVAMQRMLGGNLITWRSQKQSVVSHSSAESEYRAMANTTSQMLWLRSLLIELNFPHPSPMKMYCDNEATTFIASNDTFHMRTKHIEIDCHLIR